MTIALKMVSSRVSPVVVAAALVTLAFAVLPMQAKAEVETRLSLYSGASYTHATRITIAEEGEPTVTLDDAVFKNKPLTPPPYYGIRYGRYWPKDQWVFDRFGVEAEFLHFKLYYDHANDPGGIIQRFDVTDGLNLFFLNVTHSRPWGDYWAMDVRTGIGPVVTHPETEVRGRKNGSDGDPSGYQFSGLGGQIGLSLAQTGAEPAGAPSGLFFEYKFTFAKPRLEIADGYAEVPVFAHHFLVGWAFAL